MTVSMEADTGIQLVLQSFQTFKNETRGSYISGPDLCKFYSRPVDVKYKPGDVLEIEYESENEEAAVSSQKANNSAVHFVTVGIQTDYRESESQTDPWDPPFMVQSTTKEPEVLQLKTLSYGKGLPVTQTEVDYILENRRNRRSDVPSEGLASYEEFLKKKQMICHQVHNEWNYRIAKESEKLLDKLKRMESTLAQELTLKSERQEKLLRNLRSQKKEQMDKVNARLHKELNKELKGLQKKSKSESQKFDAKAYGLNSTAKELAVYINKNKDSLNKDIDYLISKYHMNPNGLLRLTEWLERKRTLLYNDIPIAKPVHKNKRDKLAEEAYHDLLMQKRSKLPPKLYHEDYDEEELVSSPVKAEVEFEILELPEEGVDLVTVWQQVLRGRAYQKQMLELIAKHKDALDVLLSRETLRKL